MALPPIKLRLDGEEIHLVAERDLQRWGGFLNGRRAAYELVSPDNIAEIRRALMCPRHVRTDGVFTELRKQLEDGSALFFEIPPEAVPWDAPPVVDIKDLLPTGGDETYGPDGGRPDGGLHWIEIVCVSASGGSFAGERARIRLPDGRSEFVTLDGRSSVRFDDMTEGGTVHFELSGDAVARGTLELPGGTRYELGAPIGLSTRRQHVLQVHPNPRAFVSVELFVDEEPVLQGLHTLTSANGDESAALDGTQLRADGFVLPSSAHYAFEEVILPPRPAVEETEGKTDGGGEGPDPTPITPLPTGTDPSTHAPSQPVPEDSIRVSVRLPDGTPLRGTITLTHARVDEAEGDEAEFDEVEGEATLTLSNLQL